MRNNQPARKVPRADGRAAAMCCAWAGPPGSPLHRFPARQCRVLTPRCLRSATLPVCRARVPTSVSLTRGLDRVKATLKNGLTINYAVEFILRIQSIRCKSDQCRGQGADPWREMRFSVVKRR